MEEQEAASGYGFIYVLTIDGMPDRVLISTKLEWPEIHAQLVFGDEDGEAQYELGYATRIDRFVEFYTDFETEFEEQRIDGDEPLFEMDLEEAVAGIEEIKIALYESGGSDATVKRGPNRPLQPDEILSRIIGAGPMARTEVVRRLWQYIKVHDLQDKKNRRMINADERFLAVFEKDQFSMFEMTKIANKHLR